MNQQDRYINIDEDGYFNFDGQKVEDEKFGRELIRNISVEEKNRFSTSLQGNRAWIEYFDAPLVARHVHLKDTETGTIDLPYNTQADFKFSSLSNDEWDRFHGETVDAIPFVFSRQAQFEFFDLLDSFDDDSVTIKGRRYPIEPWLKSFSDANHDKFWTNIYQTETPGWELNGPAPALKEVLPQLKLSKCRVLVLGCGSGHDAALFADAGHFVTGVDFSEEAIARATKLYGGKENLKFVKGDAFALPKDWAGKFDLIFEHTCYCAITPERRDELVQVWRSLLAPHGHLLGIFFVMEKREGPPFGGSEWEVRERLKKGFDFLYWTRWRHSIENRKGREIVVYARKKTNSV